jgi:hypothetical protein
MICGKYFSTLKGFRVQEKFPADFRRFVPQMNADK